MATKQKALGALVKVDEDGDGLTPTTVGLTTQITPPARTRAKIDRTALADTLATNEPGIEEPSELKVLQFWHPGDTDHEKIDTLFASGDEVDWQVIYPFDTPVTDEFTGWVSAINPNTLEVNGMIAREFTVERTSAITRT